MLLDETVDLWAACCYNIFRNVGRVVFSHMGVADQRNDFLPDWEHADPELRDRWRGLVRFANAHLPSLEGRSWESVTRFLLKAAGLEEHTETLMEDLPSRLRWSAVARQLSCLVDMGEDEFVASDLSPTPWSEWAQEQLKEVPAHVST